MGQSDTTPLSKLVAEFFRCVKLLSIIKHMANLAKGYKYPLCNSLLKVFAAKVEESHVWNEKIWKFIRLTLPWSDKTTTIHLQGDITTEIKNKKRRQIKKITPKAIRMLGLILRRPNTPNECLRIVLEHIIAEEAPHKEESNEDEAAQVGLAEGATAKY